MDERIIQGWRERFKEERKRDRERHERARGIIPSIVAVLKRHGAERIILFGSICEGNKFGDRSDIDIAVEGITEEEFLRTYADCMTEFDFEIDLKPLERLRGLFRKMVLEKGEIIYEKEK
jgi:predicted nucleotidyltransferase